MQTQQNFLTDSEEGIMYYQKTEKGCGSQWLEYRNHCYFHNQMKATWTEAKLWCESRYAHLVEIESKEESDWLARTFLLKDTCPSFIFDTSVAWTGGNDLVIEGQYQWNDSPLAMNFSNWFPGEPSAGDPVKAISKDCIDLLKNGEWNDRPCSFLNPFIYEMT
ncbi:low affinity immunoglobulin epsilon Fc receptor-like [Saccostrea echinata]|uniref:low affinity immunoglobulin epsilon Fc receptor-like n=1 Tax=Saccostrea echinata TaxID=191078 RepID=UPI002A812430|nr:low affinity immunoglobulin epsilon Fc receptor-like [Saccostrea echinata]